MLLNDLKLHNFRNYENLELSFDPGVNLIVGNNAQGKTNLLEAIAYAGSGKSFRAQKTSEMVRFGADFAEIEGNVKSGSTSNYTEIRSGEVNIIKYFLGSFRCYLCFTRDYFQTVVKIRKSFRWHKRILCPVCTVIIYCTLRERRRVHV